MRSRGLTEEETDLPEVVLAASDRGGPSES